MTASFSRLAFVFSLLVTLLIGACTSTPPSVAVASKWSDAIARYNLIPIYPMQEDVQIGDVFVYIPPLEDDPNVQPSTWLVRVGSGDFKTLLAALNEDYCQRIRLEPAPSDTSTPKAGTAPPAAPAPAAPAATILTTTTVQGVSTTQRITLPPAAKTAAAAPVHKGPAVKAPQAAAPPAASTQWPYETKCPPKPPQAAAASGTPPTAPYPFDIGRAGAATDLRLHRVELPGISVASVTEAELAAAIPINTFLGHIGLGASSDVGMDITLSGVEEVHMPFKTLFNAFETGKGKFAAEVFPPGMMLEYIFQKRPDLLPKACFVDLDALNDSHMQVMVANEVVYAHGIDYSYRSSSTLAGQIGASLAAATAGAPKKASSTGSGGTGGQSGGTDVTITVNANSAPAGTTPNAAAPPKSGSTPQSGDAALAALSAENARLAGLTGSLTGPGGALQAGIGRSGSLTLSDKFAEPLAFGIGDLLVFSASDLVELYKKVYRDGIDSRDSDEKRYAAEIASNLTKYYPVFCNSLEEERPQGSVSLLEYVTPEGPRSVINRNDGQWTRSAKPTQLVQPMQPTQPAQSTPPKQPKLTKPAYHLQPNRGLPRS